MASHGDSGGSSSSRASPETSWRQQLYTIAENVVNRIGGPVPLPLLATTPEVMKLAQSILAKDRADTGSSQSRKLNLQQLLQGAFEGSQKRLFIRSNSPERFLVVALRSSEGRSGRNSMRHRSDSGDEGYGKKKLRSEGAEDMQFTPRAPKRHHQVMPAVGPLRYQGVELWVINGEVPVVSLDKASPFDQYAAWMLQLASDDFSKAERLMLTPNGMNPIERGLVQTCKKACIVGHGDEVGTVASRDFKDTIAIGISGKRSMMLSLSLALCCRDPERLRKAKVELRELKLESSYLRLVDAMKSMQKEATGG